MKIAYKRYIRSMPHTSFGKKGKNKTKGQPWAMGWGFGKNRQAQNNPISNGQMVKLGAYFLQPSLCVGLFCLQIICKILSWMLALKSSRTLDKKKKKEKRELILDSFICRIFLQIGWSYCLFEAGSIKTSGDQMI